MDEVKLLPCPFCGSHGAWENGWLYVACVRCGADGPAGPPEKAIAAWNTRAIEVTRPTDMEVRDAE